MFYYGATYVFTFSMVGMFVSIIIPSKNASKKRAVFKAVLFVCCILAYVISARSLVFDIPIE